MNTTRKPFFARLLENQELEKVSGGADQTTKYPSDNDDHITSISVKLPPAEDTNKYPSDSDESEL